MQLNPTNQNAHCDDPLGDARQGLHTASPSSETSVLNRASQSHDNPFNTQSLSTLQYVETDFELSALADRLKRHKFRGAICGPDGCGKSALLKALGDQLMEHGLTPLPLFVGDKQQDELPMNWQRIIRRARPTDLLLFDGYDRLPAMTRAWVRFASRRAGGLLVTAKRRGLLPTIARPTTSPVLFRQLIDQLAPTVNGSIDHERLYREAQGNLRDAFELAYQQFAQR